MHCLERNCNAACCDGRLNGLGLEIFDDHERRKYQGNQVDLETSLFLQAEALVPDNPG